MDRSQRERLWNNAVTFHVHSMMVGKPPTTIDDIIEVSLGEDSMDSDQIYEAHEWLRRNTAKIQQAAADAASSLKSSGSELHRIEEEEYLELNTGWGKTAERSRPDFTPNVPQTYCPQCNRWVGSEHHLSHISTPWRSIQAQNQGTQLPDRGTRIDTRIPRRR